MIAGIVIFLWGGIYHMALGVDAATMKTFADDAGMATVMKEKVKDPGFYFFPNEMDPEKMAERAKTEPRGVMLYLPAGTPFSMGSSLGVQAVTDISIGLALAWLLQFAGVKGMGRVLCFALTVSVLVFMAAILPWWNWYGMPLAVVGSSLVEMLVAFGAAGAVLGKLLK